MRKLLLIPLSKFLAKHPFLVMVLLGVYLISPMDTLPEALTGVIGYIDDAILIVLGLLFLNRRPKTQKTQAKGDVIETTAEIKKQDLEE